MNKFKTKYRKDYQVPAYLIETVDLTFQLFDEYTDVHAVMKININPASTVEEKQLVLDGKKLDLLSLQYNSRLLKETEYTLTDSNLTMDVQDDSFELTIITRIYPEANTSLQGLYRSNSNYCTQCEAEGFRNITYYVDRPDNLSRFTTRIEGDKKSCPVMLSNGNRIDEGELDNDRHYVVWEDPFPKPSYLFALVAGQLLFIEDSFTTKSGREVVLRIYVEKQNIDKCEHAMRSLKKSMAWDEQVFGLEYDLDIFMIVAVDDFNMGAMENKGLNIFNSKYILALPETATDADYMGIEGVVAHEYFHNWTGNRVTCRDWFQLSLKEGLTVFRDQEFSADMNSRAVQRVDDVSVLRLHQFREDGGPMAHPIRPDSYQEINNFYTVTVYNKGAEVIRMMHKLLGPGGFRKGMDLYFQRHDGQAVTCDDFVQAMSDANDYDLSQFKNWYRQAGTPELRVSTRFDESSKEFSLVINQSCLPTPGQPTKEPFHIPVEFGLLDPGGKEIVIPDYPGGLIELKKTEQTFTFKDIDERPVVSFLRGFSAPVKVTPFLSRKDLMFLMANDSDLFNRWEAANGLAEAVILDITKALQNGDKPVLDNDYVEAVKKISEKGGDKALLSQALLLPSESYLALRMDVIDPDNLHAARQFVRRELGSQLGEVFSRIYAENGAIKEFSLSPEAMGERSLKNRALSYLMADVSRNGAAASLCIEQYRNATNMTDTIGALSLISDSDIAERDELLDHFYDTWKHDPLVMDKWLVMQAVSHRTQALDEVKALMKSDVFSMKNPNKVRSLIGAFCSMNHVRFHANNGAGYEFLGDQILYLDGINPQIAARLVTPFTNWKMYDENRQQKIVEQLERIVSKKDISRDVYEIVEKSL